MPAVSCGVRTAAIEALREDPTFRAEHPFWESPCSPERPGRQRGGWTERRLLGARARGATCVILLLGGMEGSFPAPSPGGASFGCEACGVWSPEAQILLAYLLLLWCDRILSFLGV